MSGEIERRKLLKFLVLLGLSSVSCARAASEDTKTRTESDGRIIIIGAGLAGLAAARELQSSGKEVLILEARERIGGRIWTSDKWKDMPLDLGASWIHGTKNNPLSEIADKIGAKRIATSYENSAVYDTNGAEITAAQIKKIDSLRAQIEEIIDAAQENQDIDILSAIKNSNLGAALNGPDSSYINFILSSEIEQEFGGGADELSAHYWDSSKEFDGEDVLFANGFKQIIEYLSQDLKIELGQIVQEIDANKAQIKIITQKQIFHADSIIVTVPLGVLKSEAITFSPDLPPNKKAAIANLGMGVLNKCYLRFAEVFWPNDIDWIEYVSQTHGAWSEWVSFKNAADFNVLLGFNAAQSGRDIESLNDTEIVESAMETLRTIFGASVPKPIDYQITRWASDPFSQGSYSFNKTGTSPKDRQALFAPIDERLFFAGEAAQKDYFGTAHGAYISGIDAAREILENFGKTNAD